MDDKLDFNDIIIDDKMVTIQDIENNIKQLNDALNTYLSDLYNRIATIEKGNK